jgi:hypothetical protein
MTTQPPTAEEQRLAEAKEFDARNLEDSTGDRTMNWRLWGTYLSDRQWGTVREDYSRYGSFWDYLSHDASRFRAYRWGEDGLAGFCDLKQRICFALALWNGHDPILKERLFGLTNPEGNHGEDVKEYYFHLDNTPTHSYAKWLYKYPQREFPYNELVRVNGRRKRDPHYSMEYELLDTGCFEGDCYFDVAVEFAKKSATDILIRIDVTNRGPKTAVAHVLPTLWFRNTWTWHENADKPSLREKEATDPGVSVIRCSPLTDDDDEKYAKQLGEMALYCLDPRELLFTENETNNRHLFGSDNASPYTKDAFHRYLVNGDRDAVNPARVGTKAAARYELDLAPGKTATIRLRLTGADAASPFGPDFDATFPTRLAEADEFYAKVNPFPVDADHRSIQRQDGMAVGIHQMCTLILPDGLVTHPSGHDSEASAPTPIANVGEGTSCISMVAEGERMLLFVDDSAGTEGLASGRGGWRGADGDTSQQRLISSCLFCGALSSCLWLVLSSWLCGALLQRPARAAHHPGHEIVRRRADLLGEVHECVEDLLAPLFAEVG